MSRFVSAGTAEDEQSSAAAVSTSPATAAREEAWATAQRQIDAARRQTGSQQRPRPGEQEGGKSLYETLQANKAAKQEAFEEAARLKNQFRSLDDDEVEFLDSVLESTRAKDAEVKKETRDQLEAFRRQQEEAEKGGSAREGSVGEGEDAGQAGVVGGAWSVGARKRKKGREREGLLGGVKVRRTSTAEKAEDVKITAADSHGSGDGMDKPAGAAASPPAVEEETVKAAETTTNPTPAAKTTASNARPPSPPAKLTPTGLGLGAYSSDEDA